MLSKARDSNPDMAAHTATNVPIQWLRRVVGSVKQNVLKCKCDCLCIFLLPGRQEE